MEMIKGIEGHGYHDELVLPIIENAAHEAELVESFLEAINSYPKATAVLVRNHGVYVWGDSWITAKTQAECYHYVFDAAIKLHQLGVDRHVSIRNINGISGCGVNVGRVLKAGSVATDYMIEPSQHIILLDVEGTTTPVSFVSNNLFAYARNNVGNHLAAIIDTEETQDDIDLLRSQGHIRRTGFQNQELVGVVFDDVPEALEIWHAGRIKVYIYSSCSREAQQLLFANSNYGDLRKYFSGYFDTTVGEKNEIRSYIEILRTVGVDRAADMLYVTAVSEEAVAARAAGLEVVISVRPGNGALTDNHGFRMIKSLLEI